MKKQMFIAALAITLIGGGAGFSRATGGPPDDFGRAPAGWGMNHGPRPDRLAKVLKLTDAQQGKIRTIMDAERAQAKPLLDKVRGYREQLQQAAEATTFDEAAVRGIATSLAQTESELTVSRTREQSQINAILTAEQRELLKNLRPPMDRQPQPPPLDAGPGGEVPMR